MTDATKVSIILLATAAVLVVTSWDLNRRSEETLDRAEAVTQTPAAIIPDGASEVMIWGGMAYDHPGGSCVTGSVYELADTVYFEIECRLVRAADDTLAGSER